MNSRNDRYRVKRAFEVLRKKGYFARMNFSCCGSCGTSEIDQIFQDNPEKYPDEKYVFYHNQDNDAYDKNGDFKKLNLRWSGNPTTIILALIGQGLDVTWSGSHHDTIVARHVKGESPTFEVEGLICSGKSSGLSVGEIEVIDNILQMTRKS